MQRQISPQLRDSLFALKAGKFVLLHDSEKREDEIDMVIAAEHITPQAISMMRTNAGGLICAALEHTYAKNLGLSYMHEMLFGGGFDSGLKGMIYGITKYGDHPTFSISVNHVHARTGITDSDRALTASTLAKICQSPAPIQKNQFVSSFRTPGHIPLLIAEQGLLQKRQGHTEMSVFLMKMAGLTPVSIICEMLDSRTHAALRVDEAQNFAKENNIPTLDATELLWLKDWFPWSS